MHIADWDEKFLAEFDAQNYVELLCLSQVQSAVVYAQSHVGLCYFPTKIGEMHRGLKGKDIFGEVVNLCHQKGIYVVAYYSLIFNDWAYKKYPDWRIISADGRPAAEKSRYGVCCPNSPYRDFAIEQITELIENYDFEGIRYDMTFWPGICYCPYCQTRFADIVVGDLPKIIDWTDSKWVGFQRKREEWLNEFAELVTSTTKKIKPNITVEHQSSTFTLSWNFSVTTKLAEQNDFLQGDFYGDSLQGSFVGKLFYHLSPDQPFGFETTTNLNLGDHTTLKSKQLLEAKVFAALANCGAFVFIDAIDPVGTLNRKVYEMMREIFNQTKQYEPYLGGEMVQDVVIYFSTDSKFDFSDNGKYIMDGRESILELGDNMPHLNAALNVTNCFISNHIPFGVITKKDLNNLSRYKVLVLPNVLMMSNEEVEAIKNYVQSGGCLYASKYTSLVTIDGTKHDNFLLSELFSVSYEGETKEDLTYISPTENNTDLFLDYSQKYPLSILGTQLKIKAKKDVEILGKMVLPYTDPKEPGKYASIHSNPPGIWTEQPAIVFNNYGKGNVIYVNSDMENNSHHHQIFLNLIRKLYPHPLSFESDAHNSVEITLFHQQERKQFILNLVNFQKEFPIIPNHGIKVTIKIDNKRVKQVVELPAENELTFELKNEFVKLQIPQLKMFAMVAIIFD